MARMVSGWRSAVEGLPQRTRRLVAVAALVGLPGGLVWDAAWHATKVSAALWGPFLILFGAATGFGALVLYTYVRDRADSKARLDERQRQLRDRAWMVAYEVLSAVVTLVVIVLGVTVLGFGKTVILDWQIVTDIVICSVVVVPLLPVAALAWIEPDAPAEQ